MDEELKEYIENWIKKAGNDLRNVRNNFLADEEDIPQIKYDM